VTVRIVPEKEWTHGEAKGICEQLSLVDVQPLVEVRDRENDADLARTLIHKYAHALLHFDVDGDTERSKREVEAEAVALSSGGTTGSIPVGRRSTWSRGSPTVPMSFATGLAELVGRQKNSPTSLKTDSRSFINQRKGWIFFDVLVKSLASYCAMLPSLYMLLHKIR